MKVMFMMIPAGQPTLWKAVRSGPEATNELAANNPLIKSADEYFVRPQYYSAPREVRLGVMLEF